MGVKGSDIKYNAALKSSHLVCVVSWASLSYEKYTDKIDTYRGFIEMFINTAYGKRH